jgi:Family of unknown function (DUF6091)
MAAGHLGGGPRRPAGLTALVCAALGWPVTVQAQTQMQAPTSAQKVCVFDPIGTRGDAYRALEDYRIQMARHGVELSLKTYTDEAVAVSEFKVGQCDAVMATALRIRQFNPTTTALDSAGASSILRNGRIDMDASFEVVRRFIVAVSSPKAANLTRVGAYEVTGILPLGAAYAFVNDRAINTLQAAAGKRVGAFDHDKSQAELISRSGARPVAVNVANFASMFNNNNIDVLMAPSLAYKPFELHKGMGKKGAVARFPLSILTYQMVIRADRFPPDFGQRSRDHFVAGLEQALTQAKKADQDIPASRWIDPTPEENDQYMVMMRQGRVLMANKGYYDKTGLKILKKIRCSIEAAAAECTERTEMWP